MNPSPKPFDCEYNPQFAQLLNDLGISLAISTYQAGKVVMMSPVAGDQLMQLPRTFAGAMGMASTQNRLAVACRHEVIELNNIAPLAASYPTKPNVYDAMYVPRATIHTGYLAMHDMEYLDNHRLVGVNTLFSCLAEIDGRNNFTPIWKPPFISELLPEDRCHMNGMAVDNHQIRYLTALGSGNTAHGWRDNKLNGGILMEYPSGEIILSGLSMPHSPRVYDGKLYLLNSAQGELIEVDVANKRYEVVVKLGGFARGMARCGDYLFIGLSKLRHNSKVFADLPIAQTSFAGVVAVYLPYKTIVGQIRYAMSVDEIYDVKVIPAMRPNILSPDMDVHQQAYAYANVCFWADLDEKKSKPAAADAAPTPPQPSAQVTARLLKDVSPAQLMSAYPALIPHDVANNLTSAPPAGHWVAIVAQHHEQPLGLTLIEVFDDRRARQLCVSIDPNYRDQGIEAFLSRQIQIVTDKNQLTWPEETSGQ
ncbi:MAG: TIGR03032 family protein [Marinilabiliaceae bacterium]|nr:TIGR03032 family protein [Marinilabiliaceae bacterium]